MGGLYMKSYVKKFIFAHPNICSACLRIVNLINLTNSISGKRNNKILFGAVFRTKSKIRINGKGNTIVIDDYSRLVDSNIYICGDNNRIHVGKRCYLFQADFYIEDSNNEIVIGEHTSVDGETQFAAIEGTKIQVGADCMFSKNIYVRTGDAHSILDSNGQRVNYSQNVVIGSHCWVGMNATIMKGVVLPNNSIVGAGTIITKPIENENCIIAGVPGRIVKHNVMWDRQRKKNEVKELDDYSSHCT